METHSNILTWTIPMNREAWRATACGTTESDTTERLGSHVLKHLNCDLPHESYHRKKRREMRKIRGGRRGIKLTKADVSMQVVKGHREST